MIVFWGHARRYAPERYADSQAFPWTVHGSPPAVSALLTRARIYAPARYARYSSGRVINWTVYGTAGPTPPPPSNSTEYQYYAHRRGFR